MASNLFLTYYEDGVERFGVHVDDTLHALSEPLPSLDWLLANAHADEIAEMIQTRIGDPVTRSLGQRRLRLAQQEIWAAGVTYKRSEEARERESNQSNVYTRVYHAERPELFFKAMGYDAVTHGEAVGIRYDATWSVPEPELVVVLNARMEVVGFTVGNDMSSRDIEGSNPLYLPQAKVYECSCAVGPRIWLQPNASTYPDTTIRMTIQRAGEVAFKGETTTAQLHRSLTDLIDYLGRCKQFKHGVLLFTGTGVVPPDEFTLMPGDEVSVCIEPIGELINPVMMVGKPR